MAVLTLTDAKRFLSVKATDDEADLTTVMAAAEAAVAKVCGPLEATAVTKRVRGGNSLVLPITPVISITSVTGKSGAVVASTDYSLWPEAGVLTTTLSGFAEEFYDVVYSAGRAACPADLLQAVKEMTRHLWTTRRGPTTGVAGSEPLNARRRAEELMAPHMQPGFA